MSRVAIRKVWVAGVVLGLGASAPKSAEACSLVGSGPGSWSPQPNGALPVDAPLLLVAVAASASTSVVSASGVRTDLTREPAFGSIKFGARYGFFQPVQPLDPDTEYMLESSDGLSVPFKTNAMVPRVSAVLALKTELKTIEPYVLSSGLCYEPPFVGREITRIAEISATIEPWAPLILSVSTHDDESSSDVEQTLASHAVGSPSALKLELPLPSGLDACPRVQVLDYAGTTLLDVPQLCVTETGTGLTESVEVFNLPKDGTEPQADPQAPPSESAPQGCAFGASGSNGGFSLLLAVALLNRRLRGRRFEKPRCI